MLSFTVQGMCPTNSGSRFLEGPVKLVVLLEWIGLNDEAAFESLDIRIEWEKLVCSQRRILTAF